jgi:peptidoglycan/LPS O-acetylase OafA/YrhL
MSSNWELSGLGRAHRALVGLYELDGRAGRNLPMEGLRGLAILLVFICHYFLIFGAAFGLAPTLLPSRAFVQIGGSGVDLFFVLSGILIYRAAIRPHLEITKFLKRRIARIYPTFLTVFSLYLAVSLAVHGSHKIPTGRALIAYLLANLLLLPGAFDIPALLSAAWSLSYEVIFYVTLPFVAIVLRLHARRPLQRLQFFASLLLIYLTFIYAYGASMPAYVHYDGTFVRMTMFVAGILICEFQDLGIVECCSNGWPRSFLFVVTCTTLSLFVVLKSGVEDTVFQLEHRRRLAEACLLLLGYSALTIQALGPRGTFPRIFSFAPLRWLGNLSFSFYLIHGLVLNMLTALVLRVSGAKTYLSYPLPVLFVPFFAITFLAATVLFVKVERPLSLSDGQTKLTSRRQRTA